MLWLFTSNKEILQTVDNLVPETTAHVVNFLINHPSIQPHVCGQLVGYLDATPLVQNPDNYFFTNEVGGCGFINLAPGRYELHSFALPSARGRWVKENFERVKEWMFNHTPCKEIVTLVPLNNRMALGAARICGFKKYDTMPNSWTFEGKSYDIDAYVLYKGAV
jgi:hypothetical protein